jgi:hypothetical protein
MKLAESPIIVFVRGITLLATLIALPGIAIFWNFLPKNPEYTHSTKTTPSNTEESQFFRKNGGELATSVSAFAPESVYPALPEMQTEPVRPRPATPVPSYTNTAIQQVSWEQSPMALPQTAAPQNFESLERYLKALGAKYYRLEKWGNRGEFFRFSCLVAPSESYSYEKYFQAIDADAVAVMQSVIADIEKWKNVPQPSK